MKRNVMLCSHDETKGAGGKMNLTIKQVSKLTKLSVPTLYTYASRQKLGKKIGKRKFFMQADVAKLLKSLRKPPVKKAKPPAKKTSKRAVKMKTIRAAKPTIKSPASNSQAPTTRKPSVWGRLLFGKRSIE